jgi:hypothetical protein
MPEGIFEFKGKEVRVGNYGGVAEGLPEIINVPLPNLSGIDGGPGKPMTFEESFKQRYNEAPGGDKIASVSLSDISTNKRYKSVFIGSDPEEMHAQQQSWTDKAYNDTLKFGTLVGTTIAGGFGMVYGAGSWALGGKFSDIWSNPIMQGLDKINTAVDEALPNYYTEAEKNAEWFSKDNLFTANFLFDKLIKNSGFAVGAMLSGNIANGLIGAAGKGIGGLAARGVANLAKGTTTLGETSTAFKLFTPMLRGTARAFSVGENVSAANILRTQASSIADMASQTTKLAAIEKQAAGFTKFNLAARRTAIAAYSSAGESSFEALQTSNGFRDKLLNDYFYENGINAEGDDLAKIDDLSRRVGKMSFLSNLALLTVTEFQQLPYLAGSSFKKTRQAANEMLGKVDNAILKDGKYVSAAAEAAPSTRLGKVYKGVTDTTGALLKGKATYLFDPKEGLQELLQNAIQVGTENYYNKAYEGTEAQGIIDTFAEVAGYGLFGRDEKGEGVGALVSKEGLESALIGGLTGGPMQAMGTYAEKKQIKTHAANFLKELDNSPTLKQAFIDKMDAVNKGVQLQKDHQTAVLNNDKLESVDSMTDLMHNYLAPRIKYGKFDMIMDDLNELKASAMENNGEGLEVLKSQGIGNIDDTIESFTKRINAVQEKAKSIQEMYEYMNLNYSGQTVTGADGKQYAKYSSDVIDKLVYATTKIADYDKRLPLLAANLSSNLISIDPVVGEAIKENKVDLLNQSLDIIRSIDNPVLRKTLEEELLDSVDLGLRRKKFINELNDIIASPEKYKAKAFDYSKTEEDENLGSVKIKTKTGESDYVIGKKYFLGEVIEYTKDGQPVYRTPTVKILGKNEDGTIQMYDVKTKEIFNVSPEKLESYDLQGLEETLANPLAKFTIKNRNKLFQHKGFKDKDGVPRQGRVRYNAEKDTLEFYYIDARGKERSKPVTTKQFEKQKGFSLPMIEALEKYDSETEMSIRELLEALATDNAAQYRESVEARNKIIKDLYEDATEQVESINDKLQKNKEKIQKIVEDIEEIKLTKTGKPRARISKTLQKTLDSLVKLREDIELENEVLLDRKADLEYDIPYFESLIEEYKDFEGGSQDFIDQLNNDLKVLSDLYEVTDKAIGDNKKMTDLIDELYKKALEGFNEYIDNLKLKVKREDNVIVPLYLDELQDRVEKMLGEEGAKYYIANKEGLTELVSNLQDSIYDYQEKNDLPELTRKVEALPRELEELIQGLDDLVNRYVATSKVLSKFESFVEEQNRIEEEQKAMATNKERKAELEATKDVKAVQNKRQGGKYEPAAKKPTEVIGRATMAPNTGKPHQVRANNFGARLDSFPEGSVHGVYITTNNQDKKIPGLMDHLKINERGNIDDSIETDSTVALLMVNEEGIPVDEFGQPISNPAEYISKGIYQVFADDKLTWDAKWSKDGKTEESMFRKGTPETIEKAVRKAYAEWKAKVLKSKEIGELHSIAASFGIPQYVLDKNNEPNYSARTNVLDAGLVSVEDLETKIVLRVPKTEAEGSQGLTAYDSATGKVFVQLPNSIVPVQNRKHTEEEASSIFDALVKLAEYANDIYQDMKDPEPTRILEYLKSVVYWGIPLDAQGNKKPAGYNSIFFETDQKTGALKLTISKEGLDFTFTPTELLRNKNSVIDKIMDIYGNVNSQMLDDINREYEQIISISEDGQVESVTWQNYQTYLISNTLPSGEAREMENTPLSTAMRPLNDAEDINRSGIYFYTTDNADDYAFAETKKAARKPSKKRAPVNTKKSTRKKPAAKQPTGKKPSAKKPEEIDNTDIDPDGETINTFTFPDGKKISYAVSPNVLNMKGKGVIILKDEEDYDAIVEKIAANPANKGKNAEKLLLTTITKHVTTVLESREEETVEEEEDEDFDSMFTKGVTVGKTTPKSKKSLKEDSEDEEETPISNSLKKLMDAAKDEIDDDEAPFREKILNSIDEVETEDWDSVEEFVKKVLPTIPFYRVKNLIKATNGRQAWGMFKDAAVYVYENAEVGTTYHEVFHAVWRMFTSPKEQQLILNELRNKQGTFFDRTSRTDVSFSDATDIQLEEHLAEKFRDRVQEEQTSSKPSKEKSLIEKLFDDLVKFIKEMFLGPNSQSNTDKLFEKITSGYFAKSTPYAAELSFANKGFIEIDEVTNTEGAQFSEVVRLSDKIRHEVIEHMTYATLLKLTENDASLFQDPKISKLDLYDGLKKDILTRIAKNAVIIEKLYKEEKIGKRVRNEELQKINGLIVEIQEGWESLVDQYEDYLKGYNVEFDENDNIQLNDDNVIKESDKFDATKIDAFKKANRAIKLLLSTIPYLNEKGGLDKSSINGARLIPVSQVNITLLNALSGSRNVDDMLEKLKALAKNDINYKTLYKRITKKDVVENGLALNKVTTRGNLQLISSIWSLFKKYNSTVKVVSVLENGEVILKNAFLSNAAEQLRQTYLNSITTNAKSGKGLFKYSPKGKGYFVNRKELDKTSLVSKTGMASFLNKLGVPFTVSEINRLEIDNPKEYVKFKSAVGGLKSSLYSIGKVSSFYMSTLSIGNRLYELAEIKSLVSNPETDSVFYNIDGEMTQAYIGPNATSQLFETLDQISSLTPEELAATPQFSYLLSDTFTKGSALLKRMFTEKGTKKESKSETPLFTVGYVGGFENNMTGKKKQSSKLNYKDRLLQELNLNIKGWFLNLVPGDASIEHMIYMGNEFDYKMLSTGMGAVNKVFKDYFFSELAVSQEKDRPFVEAEGRKRTDLRFFKSILANTKESEEDKRNKLHDTIVEYAKTHSFEETYLKFEKVINSAIDSYMTTNAENLKETLEGYGLIGVNDFGKFTIQNTMFPKGMSEKEMELQLKVVTANYMVANIEMHKLLYSDPYQYVDELKRTKSFNSPRQLIIGGKDSINQLFNAIWNKGFKKGEIGYTDFTRGYFRTVTHQDVIGEIDLPGYEPYKETDGAGIISYSAYRNFRIRAGQWSDGDERQYKYEVAWEKQDKAVKAEKSGNKKLADELYNSISYEETQILDAKNPKIQSAFTDLKPIVSGNKADGNTFNDVVLDKFALYPLSYRLMSELNPNSNAVKLYNKMQNENVDYIIFSSGRKVGAINAHPTYDSEGKFNDAPYVAKGKKRNVVNVPFEIMSVQSEVPFKEKDEIKRGTQVTKLVTLDALEAGVPTDFMSNESFENRYEAWYSLDENGKNEASPLFKEIQNNQALLESIINKGYNNLLRSLGIEEIISKSKEGVKTKSFKIVNFSSAATTLRNEILKRHVNSNIIMALNDFIKGESVLEATPAYQQIRNILYSIADREVISSKISGGMKVQISSTMLEENKIKPITRRIKGKNTLVFQSDVLDFYSMKEGDKEINVCEMMVGRWFKSPLSDKDLLEYLNNTPEGQEILKGFAYRIPTQKQNSIDVFKIKQFLPEEFKDSVVVPSALVAKVGSDFDIDKLSMYFKNVKVNSKGYPELIKFTKDEENLANRYYDWVLENSNRDTKNYIKWLAKPSIKEIKEKFNDLRNEIKDKYKGDIRIRREELYNSYQENVSVTKEKLTDQEIYIKELFAESSTVFFNLPQEEIDDYTDLKIELRIRGLDGPVELENYLGLTLLKIESSEDAEVIDTLTDLAEYYKQQLIAIGAKQEYVNTITKDALAMFRENKNISLSEITSKMNIIRDEVEEKYGIEMTSNNLEVAKEIAETDELPTLEEFSKLSVYEQNTRKAVENAYIKSLQDITVHKSNYERLIQPNSAEDMKSLSEKIANKVSGSTFNYKDAGNMLNRMFMSSLRHAFVTGKYAIGIAAVNQTNHSLNQRQLVYIDKRRLANVDEKDALWLADASIHFRNYNSVVTKDKGSVATLSKIRNAERSKKFPNGQDISDIIGQFIDGYVDISAGPWIMELGATPNVASTWLFLVKIGVPINDIAYFMNQPIIRDYLKSIEKAGYSYLFMPKFVTNMLNEYNPKGEVDAKKLFNDRKGFRIPNESDLESTLGKSISELTRPEKYNQQMMLLEFMKYAKLGEQLFHVTQGTNFDTANFNDPNLVWKKSKQLEKARKTVISDVDEILDNSFLGDLQNKIGDFRNALAEILKSDKRRTRTIIQKVLEPYVDMSDNDFVKLSRKAVNDFFDWAVQSKSGDESINKDIARILLEEGGIGEEVINFVKSVKRDPEHDLYDNHIINIIEVVPSKLSGEGHPTNIKIKGIDNKVYDQNNIIFAFRELRNYLKGQKKSESNIYDKLKLLAVLQSGLSTSPISFTNLIPYEDFSEIYSKVLDRLEELPNMEDFYNLGVFQRNNWNNDDVVPTKTAIKTFTGIYNPAMKYLPKNVKIEVEKGNIPPVVSISTLSPEGKSEYIVYTWKEIPKGKKESEMREEGDYSFMKKGLFKKVYDIRDLEYIHSSNDKDYFVYKAVNAWGDGFRAQEFYDEARQSVIDNGFVKVEETRDSAVINTFGKTGKKSLSNKLNDASRSKRKLEQNLFEQKDENIPLSDVDDSSDDKLFSEINNINVLSLQLKDGNTYLVSEITNQMMTDMGYAPSEIGKFIKKYKC